MSFKLSPSTLFSEITVVVKILSRNVHTGSYVPFRRYKWEHVLYVIVQYSLL